ncbi:MAG: hypothetical protein KIT84_21630 [Labilithrix sp.]|nr:hypothetical protein [Labilithrix sp.]MCW5813645.1 hypothetical protein [Labilithrix sp.]
MSSLKSTIEGLASQFAMSVIGALRSASLAEVMEVTSGGARAVAPTSSRGASAPAPAAAPAPARRGPGRPKKVAAAAPAASAPAAAPAKRRGVVGRPGRLGRRSMADISKVIDDIAALLQKHPGGLRAEEIRRELGVQSKELPRPLADGLAAGRFSKQGQKRATTYFPGGAKSAGATKPSAKPSGRGLPKKRGK